ncbi:13219_t:CDS:1 [Funneliformis geosporum]|uniref:14745_t:CDS:1 n=1 Tax=Funneliformis geosporum TaxID=1117311 RepID=A0A9W4SQ19_9GLOM|nr:13219_t:CDS:1 [Funneliformis geosporum]CAI2176330.1 14745_t:CDS:1 [Funneliformis geosporum]
MNRSTTLNDDDEMHFAFQNVFINLIVSTYSLETILSNNPPYELTLTIEGLLPPTSPTSIPPRPRRSRPQPGESSLQPVSPALPSSLPRRSRPVDGFTLFKRDLVAKWRCDPSVAFSNRCIDSIKDIWESQTHEVKHFFHVLAVCVNRKLK